MVHPDQINRETHERHEIIRLEAFRAFRGFRGLSMLIGLFACGAMARAQESLPDGPGKDETARICGQCHPADRGTAVRLTREGWQEVLAKMISLGARGTDEELAAVLDYLSTNFKGEALRPININTATAIDLESVAGLLRKEAAAVIAYRTKHGRCKALDDLKKVPGVDFRKIDRRRDRLVCF
jgi:competence protein ComEA